MDAGDGCLAEMVRIDAFCVDRYEPTLVNGPGCRYVTSAHGVDYHDYSTGFRCCRDAD